jgi:hypothetical protein
MDKRERERQERGKTFHLLQSTHREERQVREHINCISFDVGAWSGKETDRSSPCLKISSAKRWMRAEASDCRRFAHSESDAEVFGPSAWPRRLVTQTFMKSGPLTRSACNAEKKEKALDAVVRNVNIPQQGA